MSFIQKPNSGLVSSLNLGLEKAKGKYFYLIASDDEAQLKNALIKIANESYKNATLAKNLNTFVKMNYAPEKVIQKIIIAYQKNT